MGFIDPPFAGEVPFERCTDEADNTWAPLLYQPPGEDAAVANTPAVVSLDKPSLAPGNGRSYQQGGTVFLPRGLERRNGDRFTYNGEVYRLIGKTRGDHDHPITGDDFGWVAFFFARSLVSEQVIRHRGGGRDENNQLIPASDTPLFATEIVPGGGSHYVDRYRSGETTACTVSLPAGTDITNSDELTVRGQRFNIVVNDWSSEGGDMEVLCTRGQG